LLSCHAAPSALDDEAVRGPAEIGDDPAAAEAQCFVDLRVHEAAAEDEVEHGILELAAGWRRAGDDDARELRRAGPPPMAGEDGDQLADVDPVQGLGATRGTAQRAVFELGREVEEGAGR
jgi:hypothetical protein